MPRTPGSLTGPSDETPGPTGSTRGPGRYPRTGRALMAVGIVLAIAGGLALYAGGVHHRIAWVGAVPGIVTARVGSHLFLGPVGVIGWLLGRALPSTRVGGDLS